MCPRTLQILGLGPTIYLSLVRKFPAKYQFVSFMLGRLDPLSPEPAKPDTPERKKILLKTPVKKMAETGWFVCPN